jgi:hypothetical protein
MKTKITTIFFCTILLMPLLALSAAANQPPSAPEIEGPTSGKVGVQIIYGFCSADPDGDNITICINWDDGSGDVCIGPFESGLCATAPHIWLKKDTYIIKAKASDGQAESNWSRLEVKIPRNRVIYNSPLLRLFMHFPNAFLIIKQILRL